MKSSISISCISGSSVSISSSSITSENINVKVIVTTVLGSTVTLLVSEGAQPPPVGKQACYTPSPLKISLLTTKLIINS